MAKLKIYSDIVDEEQKLCMMSYGGPEGICYKDVQEFIESIPEEDNIIDIRIHCCGGSCGEGWAIYDALRRSGKTISATIEGECSSIASVILLAAPAERRYASKNMRMCLHNPAFEYIETDMPLRLTPDKIDAIIDNLEVQSKALREEQDRILDLYVERTGANRKALQALMDKDTFIDADRAQELGFISNILVPTTAHRKRRRNNKSQTKKNMAKPQDQNKPTSKKPSAFARFLARTGLARMKDQVITAANGDEFTVEREDGDPQIGDVAYPDGRFVLDDGTEIVIEGDHITEIIDPAQDPEDPTSDPDPLDSMDDPDEVRALIAELQAKLKELDPEADPEENAPQVEELQQTVEQLQKTIEEQEVELKAARPIVAKVNKAGGMQWLDSTIGMRSAFTPTNRRFVSHGAPTGPQPAGESKTQKAIRERREASAAKREKRK